MKREKLIEILRIAYRWGRDNGNNRSDKNFNDLLCKPVIKELLEPQTGEQTCYIALLDDEQVCVIAKNIAEAFDKLEAQGMKHYELTHSRSYEIIQ